jgi:hypothetical protein
MHGYDILKELRSKSDKSEYYLEDGYLDMIDKRLGISFLLNISAIQSENIDYSKIVNYMETGGDLFRYIYKDHLIYEVPK